MGDDKRVSHLSNLGPNRSIKTSSSIYLYIPIYLPTYLPTYLPHSKMSFWKTFVMMRRKKSRMMRISYVA